jgi:predicted small integral membrane protein
MERLRVYNGNTSEVRPAVVRIGSTRRGDVLLHSLLSDHEISLALLPALEEKRQAVLAAMEAL